MSVYLLHFDRTYGAGAARPDRRGSADHYLGSTRRPVSVRLAEHESGRGANLMGVIASAGIGFTLARTWPGGRFTEARLKRKGSLRRRCPLCGVKPRGPRWERPGHAKIGHLGPEPSA